MGEDADRRSPPSRKLIAKRRNERLKLVASALDRVSTVIIAGAALGPLFQGRSLSGTVFYWIASALMLHLTAQLALSAMHEE